VPFVISLVAGEASSRFPLDATYVTAGVLLVDVRPVVVIVIVVLDVTPGTVVTVAPATVQAEVSPDGSFTVSEKVRTIVLRAVLLTVNVGVALSDAVTAESVPRFPPAFPIVPDVPVRARLTVLDEPVTFALAPDIGNMIMPVAVSHEVAFCRIPPIAPPTYVKSAALAVQLVSGRSPFTVAVNVSTVPSLFASEYEVV
jgi:hypothetical protein